MKKKCVYLILAINFIFSCESQSGLRKNNNLPKNIIKINKLFYEDEKSGDILFLKLEINDKIELSKLDFNKLTVDSCYMDQESFEFYGTFGLDKNNIYLLTEKSGQRHVNVESRENYKNVIFFENSYLRIIDDTLRNYGCHCIDDPKAYDISINLNNKKIDLQKFNVIKTGSDYSTWFDFFLYEDKIYRHGCLIINEKFDYQNLKYYYENHEFAKKIKL